MDKLDQKLIIELQKYSRQSNRQLAAFLNVDEATIKRRIENLESSGDVIFTALVDLKDFGYPIHCFFSLQVNHNKWSEIGEKLCKLPFLHFISFCVGFADISIRGDFTSIEHLKNFIESDLGAMDGIERIETAIEYEEMKRTYYLIEDPRLLSPDQDRQIYQSGKKISISDMDRKLITCLQKNSRATLKELAEFIGVSQTTIHRRIKELSMSNVIHLTAISGMNSYNSSMKCHINIQTDPSEIRSIANSLCRYPEIIYIGLVSSPSQILIGVHTPSVLTFSDFMINELSKIKGILKLESLVHINVLKRTFTWI
jgi:Lrp/AsnC family transcriptional regulator, regulator for asnA, asnC and gidA